MGYFTLFAFGRFIHQLYHFGHDLDPRAPMNVDPFMPPILGSKQIANFTSSAYPSIGSVLLGVFVTGLVAVLIVQLRASDPPADGEAAPAAPAPAAPAPEGAAPTA